MTRRAFAAAAAAAAAAALAFAAAAPAAALEVTVPALADGGRIGEAHVYEGFGCSGGNVSPAIAWSGVPEGTESLAVTVYDPDAPTGSGWWHWVVLNLPADAEGLGEGAGDADGAGLPDGAMQVRTDFGAPGWGGPCPPEGDAPHRYVFTVHALDVPALELPEGASAALAGFLINAHEIARASATGLYGR